jgi:hypothetical protein
MSKFKRVDGIENMPVGKWIVQLERPGSKNDLHVAEVHENVSIIGNYFHFDMPKVIGYAELPEVVYE